MAEFVMPSLGADMAAGTLVAWKKQPGDAVARGDIIAEVETEKGLIEVECFATGRIERLLVQPGAKVPVGTPLALIGDGAASMPQPQVAPPAADTRAAEVVAVRAAEAPAVRATPGARRLMREHDVAAAQVHATGRHGTITRSDVSALEPPEVPTGAGAVGPTESAASPRLRVSPLARRMAKARGISLAGLAASGPQGSIVARDVERAAGPSAQAEPRDAQARMRAAIAAAMTRSKREIPHYYLTHTVDVSRTLRWLTEENERRPMADRLLLGVLFVRAVARALRETPELNAHHVGDAAPPLADVNVGVAVSLRGGGLVAPAIMGADRLGLDALSRAFKDVVNRARGGRLTSSEMGSATITITSLGERGVEAVFPVIIPPQVAMVGFGAVRERPMVAASTVVARPAVTVSLAADHRVSDGHRGGLFLSALAAILEEPPEP